MSTPVSVHKDSFQNGRGSDSLSKKYKLGSSMMTYATNQPVPEIAHPPPTTMPVTTLLTSSHSGSNFQYQNNNNNKSGVSSSLSSSSSPPAPAPPSGSSSGATTAAAAASSAPPTTSSSSSFSQQKYVKSMPSAVANAHSNLRFPLGSQSANNLVLDLNAVRGGPQTSQPSSNNNHNLCNNCTLAIQNDGDVSEIEGIDTSIIEESILETFQRIDAQHVSNSTDVEDEENKKMSIIENPLSSESVVLDRTHGDDVKTIPSSYQITGGDVSRSKDVGIHSMSTCSGSHGKSYGQQCSFNGFPSQHQSSHSQMSSEMMLLNNRVDELTKLVYSVV